MRYTRKRERIHSPIWEGIWKFILELMGERGGEFFQRELSMILVLAYKAFKNKLHKFQIQKFPILSST